MSSPKIDQDKIASIVGLLLKDLLKVIKVVSMYPEDNPLPQSLRRSFAEHLVDQANDLGGIAITVEKDTLNYKNEPVYTDRSKEDKLAGIFFETGITDFEFRASIDVLEVFRLLDVIRIYINSPDKNQDLVNLIWEAGIRNFKYNTVEDVALAQYDESFKVHEFLDGDEKVSRKSKRSNFGQDSPEDYVSIFDLNSDDSLITDDDNQIQYNSADDDSDIGVSGRGKPGGGGSGGQRYSGSGASSNQASFYAVLPEKQDSNIFSSEGLDEISLRTADAAEAMGFTELPSAPRPSLDTSLILNDEFKLSSEEEEIIGNRVSEDADFEPYESTLELMKELLLQESEMQAFYETVTISEKVLSEFLLAGRLIEAGKLLQHINQLCEDLSVSKPLWAERLSNAKVTAGSRERLAVLTESLNNRPDIGSTEINIYLDNFGWEALGSITDLLGDLDHQVHREALTNFLSKRGKNNIEAVAKGIYDKRWHVVRNSVTILAQIGDDRAMVHLGKVLEHEEPRVRLEIVKNLALCPNEKALEYLIKLSRDKDSEVRTKSVEAIVARRGKPAFEAISTIINEDNFDDLDHQDQASLLQAFSVLGGDSAVSYLVTLIKKFNLFRSHLLKFFRQSAFDALAHNRGEKAEKVLIELSNNIRPNIKQQALETIKRRRDIIYGDSDD